MDRGPPAPAQAAGGNAQVWEDRDFIVTVVGARTSAPISRHPYEEFFYQMKGDAFLNIMDGGKPGRVELPKARFSSCRAYAPFAAAPRGREPVPGDRARAPEGVKDGFEWYCLECHKLLHRVEVQLKSIVHDLLPY